jgi:hypothetical protein
MVLYARADVSYVCVPATSGGCGQPHTRPVVNGAPAKQFRLVCQGCENFLRADIARSGGNKKVRTVNGDYGLALKERYLGLWGASPETTPEAPDEELKREFDEQASITKNAASQTETMAQIGTAIAGNAELMGKFMELLMSSQGKADLPAPSSVFAEPLPETLRDVPPGTPVIVSHVEPAQNHCLDCPAPITRKDGQKGALPLRCPDCKAKKAASRRKAA